MNDDTSSKQPDETQVVREDAVVEAKWYKKRWFKITSIILLVIFIFGLIAGIVAYALWINTPEKALLDATKYAVQEPGKYSVTKGSVKGEFTVNDGKYSFGGTVSGVKLDAVVASGVVYLKSSNPVDLLNLVAGDQVIPGSTEDVVRTILATAKDKWISIDVGNMTSDSEFIDDLNCFTGAHKQLMQDPSIWSSLLGTYSKYQFTSVVKTSAKNYLVKIDGDKGWKFAKSIFDSNHGKLFAKGCDRVFEVPVSIDKKMSSLGDTAIKVVLDADNRFKTISGVSKDSLSVRASYENIPEIDVPLGATDINSLFMQSIQTLLGAGFMKL